MYYCLQKVFTLGDLHFTDEEMEAQRSYGSDLLHTWPIEATTGGQTFEFKTGPISCTLSCLPRSLSFTAVGMCLVVCHGRCKQEKGFMGSSPCKSRCRLGSMASSI